MFTLLFGLIAGGVGVFRYQQVACQAREAARWTCVRGAEWSAETGKPSPELKDIVQKAVWPHAAGMSRQALAVEVMWVDGRNDNAIAWNESSRTPRSLNDANEVVANRVRVAVTYEWSPGVWFVGPLKMRSVSEMPMQF